MSALDYNTFVTKHSPSNIGLKEDIYKRKRHKKTQLRSILSTSKKKM